MTSLRFVGDLPLWLGALLAAIAAFASWRYYRRENSVLTRTQRWLLPALRSTAFVLAILLLTGPVLRHRTVVGELGRIKIYVDASESMTLGDRAMSPGQKLLVAANLGWIERDRIDTRLFDLAEQLAEARQVYAVSTQQGELQQAADALRASLTALRTQFPVALQGDLDNTVLASLDTQSLADSTQTGDEQVATVLSRVAEFETRILAAWDQSIVQSVEGGNPEVAAALALFDETPRWQRAQSALMATDIGLLDQLRDHHEVEIYLLEGSEAISQIATVDADSSRQQTLMDPKFLSPTTDLSSGLSQTLSTGRAVGESGVDDSDSPPRSAVVLLTDGQHNSGPSPIEAARLLGEQGTPVYTLATGSSRAANDLAVVALEYPERVYRKDRVRGVLVVRDQADPGLPLVAQIKSKDNVLWQQALLTDGSGQRRIEFDFPVDAEIDRLASSASAGIEQHIIPIDLQASLSPLPGESETANNQRAMRLGVINQEYRVLLMDGRSRWETRYLRNVFERDERWEVTTVIAGPGTDMPTLPRGDGDTQFPANRETLFDYDLVVLGELDADLFADYELDWLESFVTERGGGLILIDGQRGKLRELGSAGLATLMPVSWLSDPIAVPVTLLDLTTAGSSVAALRLLSDETSNRRFWTELPAPQRLAAVEALPGSNVWIEADVAGRRYPAVVERQIGAGRVLYLAFDETWRWRYKSADTWHQRVWNQLAGAVMPPAFTASDEYLSIDTGAIAYRAGESATIRVRLRGVDGTPDTQATVDALLWKQNRLVSTVNLTADKSVPGMYRGRTGGLESGQYRVTIRASGYSDQALQAATEMMVLDDESDELLQTAVNEALLQQMARESGGKFLRENEIGQLPALLSSLSQGRVVESETLIWQSYGWFAAIILLLSVEWLLRKKAGLL